MIIKYKSEKTFYDGIAMLVEKGLLFKADHDSLKIALTGGY